MGILRIVTRRNYGYFEYNKFPLNKTDCYMFLKFDLKGQKKISTDTAVNVKYTNKTKSRRIY